MTDYKIAAIPTEYRGMLYRSRLEARWAAFFDLLGWRHEYEPFDLGKWSPDFLLPEWNLLVEVKPTTELDDHEWQKAISACSERKLLRQPNEESEEVIDGVLFLGLAPVRTGGRFDAPIRLGWLGHERENYTPDECHIVWHPHHAAPEFSTDIIQFRSGGWWTASGDAGTWQDNRTWKFYPTHAMGLWARATNTVQWHPKGGKK